MRSLDDTIVIKAGQYDKLSFKELWLYRELFYFFAWRDIKVRYKQTAIGVAWAVLQPLLATIIFTVFFNRVVGIKAPGDIPYAVFSYLGLMYWNLFSSSLNTISNSLLNNQGVLTKIYFPRLIPPLSCVVLAAVDFFFAGLIFLGLMLIFGVFPNPIGIFAAIYAFVIMLSFSVGLGSFLAAVNVKYRDVKAALPFLIQIMMFVTPVIYPVESIPEKWRLLAYLNPATGAISSVRGGLFNLPVDWLGIALSTGVAIVILVLGIWYFKRSEKKFVDII
ncbi:MAG TPA: ABC transporter permease [Candidatus Saccharimonadales bacterium]|nr:ABC transporter permease [Candidatus Saccharimonadales bacterium]